MEKRSKVIVTIVSLVLVVGAIIGGTVGIVLHLTKKNEAQTSASTSMKSVTNFCAPTPFKDACALSVESAAKNASANPKDFIMAALNATIVEVKKAMEVARGFSIDQKSDPFHHMAVEDCKELLDDAIDELQASLSMVGDSELHTLNDRVNELMNWLSAVYAYQNTCLDEFEKPEYRSAMEKGMLNATQLTNNAVNIVAEISEVFKAFNVELNPAGQTGRRRLLQDQTDGYPHWFPVVDRKLLAAQRAGAVRPNVVVAKDGSGRFKSISAAVAAIPPNFRGRYIIYVKAGIYDENVIIDKKKPSVFIYGDGAGRSIVTGNKNFGIMKIQTSNTATFSAIAPGFIARGMTFRNTAGPAGHQAVALRVQSDMSAVFDCSIEGYQDTLYYHAHRQFYRNCAISGTVDFIFGMGSAVIQNSELIARRGAKGQFNAVTADGKLLEKARTGVVLQNCRIVPGQDLFPVRFQVPTYLGRPWKPFCKAVFMETVIGDFVRPEGYTIMDDKKGERTAEFLEFANRGPGARTNARSKLFPRSRVIDGREAARYTAENFLDARAWLPNTGAPFFLGFTGR